MMKTVIASSNRGKLKELSALLNPYDIELVPQRELGVDDVPETGLSFVENALIKARHAAAITGIAALADDSGLAVDALQGKPGIYSARYAGENATDLDNNFKLIAALANVPEKQRIARFHCTLVLIRHPEDPDPIIAQGAWEGRILSQPRGDNGFGYDPLFYIPEHDCTSAELAPEVKNRISHRGQALEQLVQLLAP